MNKQKKSSQLIEIQDEQGENETNAVTNVSVQPIVSSEVKQEIKKRPVW